MPGSCADSVPCPVSTVRAPRRFALLHQDVLRLISLAPIALFLLPCAAWMPLVLLTEWLSHGSASKSWFATMDSFVQKRVLDLLFGTFCAAVQLFTVRELAMGRRPSPGDALRGGVQWWGRIIVVQLWSWLRVCIGAIFFIIPGIILGIRYLLANHVVVFEGLTGNSALKRSGRYWRGAGWRILPYCLGFTLLYLPMAVVPIILRPGAAGFLLAALSRVPLYGFVSLQMLFVTLLYVDLRAQVDSEAVPLAESLQTQTPGAPVTSAATPIWRGAVLSVAAVFGALLIRILCLVIPNSTGQAEMERGAPDRAVQAFERAAYWSPDDDEVQSNLAMALLASGYLPESEEHLRIAIRLDPANASYHVFLARVLARGARLTQALDELQVARQLGYPDSAELTRLTAELSAQPSISVPSLTSIPN